MIERRLVSRPVSTIGTLIAPRVTQQEGPPIVTQGLVGHWDAGNPYSYPSSGTTWTDLSGSGNDGTLNNTPTFEADRGGLLSLDGTNESVNFGRGSTLTIADNLTCSAWVRFPTGYGSNANFWQTVMCKRTPFVSSPTTNNRATFTMNYLLGSNNQFQLQFYSPAGTNRSLTVNLSESFPVNEWHHVAGVFEKSGSSTIMRLFKNGSQIGTSTVAANVLSYSDIDTRVGGIDTSYTAPFGYEYSQLRIAQAMLYNRALSAAEVFQNFQATRWRFGI